MDKIIKYRFVLISIVLIGISFFLPSLFQKGGVSNNTYYFVFAILTGMTHLSILSSGFLILFEKVFFSILFTIISVIITMIFSDRILLKFYGSEYEYVLWKLIPKISINLIFFILTEIIAVRFMKIYEFFRKIYTSERGIK